MFAPIVSKLMFAASFFATVTVHQFLDDAALRLRLMKLLGDQSLSVMEASWTAPAPVEKKNKVRLAVLCRPSDCAKTYAVIVEQKESPLRVCISDGTTQNWLIEGQPAQHKPGLCPRKLNDVK